jgi:glycosyltransferase involved in cell wall biosynthesis
MARPYFITIGTIEPRKNHALLLDVWEQLGTGPDVPQLIVLGAKGWAGPELFARLDRAIATGNVIHHADLDDGRAMGLLLGARALLFPTFAEGFGLPPIEALALGVPVIAADLPVLREVLGDKVVYLDPSDSYSWMETIRAMRQGGAVGNACHAAPRWADHFKIVLTALG